MNDPAGRLLAALDSRAEGLVIAVSGGVDSMTLAAFAHRRARVPVRMVHAVSPAVPAEATARVRALADRDGWVLTVTGAGEFEDPRYRDNPANRCYFCKTHLYDRIRSLVDGTIASGTNLDDLRDDRPGLAAAAERGVVHPYLEAAIDKAGVRALARSLDLGTVAELPAQPCLASRVETGIRITAADLAFVEAAERRLSALLPGAAALRCRITLAGVVLELDPAALEAGGEAAGALVRALCAAEGRRFAGLRRYRRGAAFLKAPG